MIQENDFKDELLDDITGKKDNEDDVISLSGIKKGELGSKEKPARTIEEFGNLMRDKITSENIDQQVKDSPLPVTSINQFAEVLKIGIRLLDPVKHRVFRYILTQRLLGKTYRELAIELNAEINTIVRAEKEGINTVKDMVCKHQTMLNQGIVLG